MAEQNLSGYEKFKEEIAEAVRRRLGERYKVSLGENIRNNTIICDTLLIMDKIVKRAVPGIYLDRIYQEYERGRTEELLAEDIAAGVSEFFSRNNSPELSCEFEDLKDKIVCKLINYDMNRAMLTTHPHIKFLDFAVVFQAIISKQENHIETLSITERIFESFGITLEELYALALANSERLLPAYIRPMRELLKDFLPDLLEEALDGDGRAEMYILSNTMGIGGATCLLYSNLPKLIESYGIGNCVILPSSIHEVILVGVEKEEAAVFPDMVAEVNATQVKPDEVLSGAVYYYSAKDKAFSIL